MWMSPEIQAASGEDVHAQDLKLQSAAALSVALENLPVLVDAPIAKGAHRFRSNLDHFRVATFQSFNCRCR